jgi:hypothetical protein
MMNPPPWTLPPVTQPPSPPDPGEDALEFVLRAERGQSDLGIDRSRPDVVEVAQVWHDIVLDVQHHAAGERPVTIGSSTGYRWRLLGAPLAWVPEGFARVAWMLAPMLSEAQQERRTDFYCPPDATPEEEFPFVRWDRGAPACHAAPSWTGFVERDGQRVSLAALRARGELASDGDGCSVLPLVHGERVVLDTGAGIFAVHLVPPGTRVPTRVRDRIDGPFSAFLASASFVGALCGMLLATTPAPSELDTIELPARFAEIFLEEPAIERHLEEPEKIAQSEGAEKRKDLEGKRGREDAEMEKAKGDAVELAKAELDKQIAEDAGVLGALRDGSELDGLLGSTGLSPDLLGGLGGLLGAKGAQYGSRGFSSRGSGFGGGGNAYGIGGMGGVGTQGRYGGDGSYGNGDGLMKGKTEGDIRNPGGDPIVIGQLDKAVVHAVVQRHLNNIRYCYQRELQRDPSMSGKVTVKFVIAGDGSVSSAETKSTTLHNSAVESCINGRFMRMEFPSPKKNGVVVVTYPFLFAPV